MILYRQLRQDPEALLPLPRPKPAQKSLRSTRDSDAPVSPAWRMSILLDSWESLQFYLGHSGGQINSGRRNIVQSEVDRLTCESAGEFSRAGGSSMIRTG